MNFCKTAFFLFLRVVYKFTTDQCVFEMSCDLSHPSIIKNNPVTFSDRNVLQQVFVNIPWTNSEFNVSQNNFRGGFTVLELLRITPRKRRDKTNLMTRMCNWF